MKPFIFQFKESSLDEAPDYSTIRYDSQLNLHVDSLTGIAAIESINLETETFTKSDSEAADSDRNGFNSLLETETRTFTKTEASDSDNNRYALNSLIETETHTYDNAEASDSDKNHLNISCLLETSTNTRNHQETTDSDPL